MQLISQGAEAKIYLTTYLGDKAIIKQRIPKTYRHPVLDQRITQERVKSESKIMAKARKLGINVPHLFQVDETSITMMYVDGVRLKDYLKEKDNSDILSEVGVIIGKLHNGGIIHGDLTTSNLLVRNKIAYLIDFGLSYSKPGSIEDFAVDLYVLEKAFLSTHPQLEAEFNQLLLVYKQHSKLGEKVLERLDVVRQRGRKKVAFG